MDALKLASYFSETVESEQIKGYFFYQKERLWNQHQRSIDDFRCFFELFLFAYYSCFVIHYESQSVDVAAKRSYR